MEHVDHIDLVVSSMERSLTFYRAFLAQLGYVRESRISGERGEPVVYLNRLEGAGSLGLRERRSDAHPVPYDRYAVGMHHVAFAAPSRRVVDECAAWLREQGAAIESEPREYDNSPATTRCSSTTPTGSRSSWSISRRTELVRTVAELRERIARLESGDA